GAMLLGGLQKVWEAVAKAVNAIVEWLWNDVIKPAMDLVLAPIYNVLNSFAEQYAEILFELYTSKITVENFFDKFDSILIPIMELSAGIAITITALQMIIIAFQYGIPVGQLIGGILSLIITSAVQGISQNIVSVIGVLTVSAIVGFLIGCLAPEDSPVFDISFTVGLTIASYITYLVQRLIAKTKKISMSGLTNDIEALWVCVASVYITMAGEAIYKIFREKARIAGYNETIQEISATTAKFAVDSTALILGLMGTFIALTSANPLEASIVGWLDECIDVVATSYDISSWLNDISQLNTFVRSV
ncbi:MAG: hypothetical protein ACP5LE_08235, partial [Thermoplasmata archaeon]